MTDNALQTPHQFGPAGSGPGYSHGIGSYNGITGGPNSDQQHAGSGVIGPSTPARPGVEYTHQNPNSPYFGGQQPSPRPPPGGGHGPGPGSYTKMGPGRGGWSPMPQSQPRFPQGSMPIQQQGSAQTPTLNSLLQAGGNGSELRQTGGYPVSEYGPGGPVPNRGHEDFSGGFGMPHQNWGAQHRMGGPGQYAQQMMDSRYEMARRQNMQGSGMVAPRYPIGSQLSDVHSSQFSPNSQTQQCQPPHMSNASGPQGQIQPSPSTTPQSQVSDHASSAQSSPPQQQQPPTTTTTKSKSKKHHHESRSQQIKQESSSSDEVNTDTGGSSRSGTGSTTVSSSQPQQPRPGSAYGHTTAPSPAGSVGSRSNTPASLQGNMTGSPSATAMHDVQNRIMSPGHPQGVLQSQQMMPPPSMMPSHASSGYPGPGGMGKLHTSAGMMHMSGPGSGVQTNPGMYGGQMYGNQGTAGNMQNYPSHGMESFNGPNQMGPSPAYRGNYGGPYAPGGAPIGMDGNFGQGGYPGSGMGPTGVAHSLSSSQPTSEGAVGQGTSQHGVKGAEMLGSIGSEDQRSSGKSDQAQHPDNQSSGSESLRGNSQPMNTDAMTRHGQTMEMENSSGVDGMLARRGMAQPNSDSMSAEGGIPQSMDGMHGRPGQPPMGMDGMSWRPSQPPGMDGMQGRNGPHMGVEGMPNRGGPKGMPYGMPGRPNQFIGMNGMSPRPQPPPFGADGLQGRPGHAVGLEGMPGRPGAETDAMPRMEPPVGSDNMPAPRPGPGVDVMQGRPGQQGGMDSMMYGRQVPPQHPGMEPGRPAQQMPMDGMLRRPGYPMGGIDPATGRPLPPNNMDIAGGRMSVQGMPGRPEESMSVDEMQARMNASGGMPGRFGMDSMSGGRPPMHPPGMDQMHMRPMQPGGMDNMPNRFGPPMRLDGMDRRTGGPPDGMGVGPPSQQSGNYGRPFPNFGNQPQPGMRGGFGDVEMVSGEPRMMDRNHIDSYGGPAKPPMVPNHAMHAEGPGNQFGEFGERRFPPPNGEVDPMKRDQPMGKMFEGGEPGMPDSNMRMQQCNDRMDFMSNNAAGIAGGRSAVTSDNMQMKCGPGGFEMDEFGRPKSAKMEKTDGMFHTPASSRIAPSPATSTQEEADSVSNASWPSTPKSGNNEVLNRLADMGDEPDRRKLLERLFAFMEERNTPIVAVPTISKIAVDLYKLYHIVRGHGGMVEVTKNKKWRDVSSALNLGPSSSAGFTLKKNYGKHLFPFECRYDRGNIDPAPLLAFLEQPSKKESKKAAAERVAAVAAAQEGVSCRPPFPNSTPSGYQHGPGTGAIPPGVDPMMMQPQMPPYSGGMIPNGGNSMPHHGMPPPLQPGNGNVDSAVNIQNPFSDGGSIAGSPQIFPRQNYGPVGGVPSSSGNYEGRGGPYVPRQPPFGLGHQGEQFDSAYCSQESSATGPGPFPGNNRFEQGPPGSSSYQYAVGPSRIEKYGPPNSFGANQGSVPIPRPGMRPYFPEQPEGYGPSYGSGGMHRGSQPWMPPGGCPTNYGPGGPETYRFANSVPAPQYNHSIGPCLSPSSRPADHSSASIPPDRFQRPPSMFLTRREISFPPDSVEATRPNLTKLKRLTHRQLGSVDPWRLLMSLKSGLIAESTWALDVLSVLLRDESTVLWFGLQHLPGLVDVLLEHFRRSLAEIFPGDFDELELPLEQSLSMKTTSKAECDKLKKLNDMKGEPIAPPSWMTAATAAEYARRARCVQFVDANTNSAAGLRAAVDGSALADEKEWDVYGEIDSSLLDWQMGRGDTSLHIQTTFSRDTSLAFAHETFFGRRHSAALTSMRLHKFDKFESFSVGLIRQKCTSSVDVNNSKDEKLPILTSATCDSDASLSTDDSHAEVNTKLEPPDIVRDAIVPKLESESENNAVDVDKRRSSSSLPPNVEEFSDDKGLESLKRKWTEELEEDSEAYERDVQSIFVASDAQIELSRRCISVSNVLRGLSFVPGNDAELARHPGLLAALGRLLLLGHRHPRESRRRMARSSSTDEDDSTNSVADDDMPILAATLDRWRWDTMDVLREDTMVIFANISGQLDLAAFTEEICIPVLDGLLHWASCSAACALDPLPSTPGSCGPSARRLSLEALCKLCVTDSNVDLLLATPPFRRIVCLLDDLVSVLSDAMSDQVAREFAVVLSSSLAAADPSAARAIALRRSAVSAFLGFIEAADRQAQQLVQAPGQQGHQMLRDNPEMMGTSIDMLRRAASVVRAIAETSDCRSTLFADHHQRLLQLSMSSTLDANVSAVITDILFLCS